MFNNSYININFHNFKSLGTRKSQRIINNDKKNKKAPSKYFTFNYY